MSLTVGSLFAGIGGFDLGFERAGFKTVWQVEINEYCRKVLARHFPDAERYADIRECGVHNLKPVDVICGGFPCQDISNAGLRAGIDGERSGLWREMHRVIGELRPRYVVVENVAALLGRGMGRVLGELSEIGYDAEWQVISAADVGAPHLRERIWVVAYPNRDRRDDESVMEERPEGETFSAAFPSSERWADTSRASELADPISEWELQPQGCESDERGWPGYRGEDVADANRDDEYGRGSTLQVGRIWSQGEAAHDGDAARAQWSVEPNVGRVAHGVPARVDRLRALGNAVVPQIPEMIARRIAAQLVPVSEPESGEQSK